MPHLRSTPNRIVASAKKCTRNGKFTPWNKRDGDIPQSEGYGVSSHKYELSQGIPMSLTMKQEAGSY